MSDILTKLQKLGVTRGMPESVQEKKKNAKETDSFEALLKTFPNGTLSENDYGHSFINRIRFPLPFTHGNTGMGAELHQSSLFDSLIQMKIPDKYSTLAFDIETSGLSSGSGNFIFMIGLGYFETDAYIVDQLILPDLDREPAFLRQAELIISRYSTLLSYNGASFDLPMLRRRLNFHLMSDFTNELRHCDLLKYTRRYWKKKLGSVRLSQAEQYILQLQRGEEEVPGYLAPELYRQYLWEKDAQSIAGVAYHNCIDVVSLSALLLHLNDLAWHSESDPEYWGKSGADENALIQYNAAFFPDNIQNHLQQCGIKEKKLFATRFYKEGNHDKALQLYKELSILGDGDSALKAAKIYLLKNDRENYIRWLNLSMQLYQQDERIGIWSKKEKIEKIQKLLSE